MIKKEIKEYLDHTPENMNWHFLSGMLDEWKASNEATTEDDLKEMIEAGGKVEVGTNLLLTEPMIPGVETELRIVDAEIKADPASEEWYMFKADGVDMTINSTGIISAGAAIQAIPVTACNNGKVIINSGTFECRGDSECVYANGGKVEIYGGTYKAVDGDTTKDLLNVQNTHEVTDIQCFGGTFIGRDPALGDDVLGGTFVAEGYESVETKPGVFVVKKIELE